MSEQVHKEKSWWVYILSGRSGKLYTGVTTDVDRRVQQHNGKRVGGAKATRAGRPWIVVHTEGPLDKVSAFRREYAIKLLAKDKKLELLSPQMWTTCGFP